MNLYLEELKNRFNWNIVRERLKTARKSKGISQRVLSESTGHGMASFVSNIETGKNFCSVDTIAEFAEVLGVSTDYLLGFTDEMNPYGDEHARKQNLTGELILRALEAIANGDGVKTEKNERGEHVITISSGPLREFLDMYKLLNGESAQIIRDRTETIELSVMRNLCESKNIQKNLELKRYIFGDTKKKDSWPLR